MVLRGYGGHLELFSSIILMLLILYSDSTSVKMVTYFYVTKKKIFLKNLHFGIATEKSEIVHATIK